MKSIQFLIGHWQSQFSNKDDSKPLQQLLQEAAQYYNLKIPGKADRDTLIDSCEHHGDSLVFTCTLFTVEKEEFEESLGEFNSHLREILQKQAATTKRLKRILVKNGNIEYIYLDKVKEPFTTIVLSNVN